MWDNIKPILAGACNAACQYGYIFIERHKKYAMKKFFIIFITILILTSCVPQSPDITGTTNQLNEEDRGETTEITTGESNEILDTLSNYTPGRIEFFVKEEKYFTESPIYNGGEFSLDFILTVGDEKPIDSEVGVIVTLNGVIQEISIDEGHYLSMPVITISPDSTKNIEIRFKPTVALGDDTSFAVMQVMLVNRPDFTPMESFELGSVIMVQHGMPFYSIVLVGESPFDTRKLNTLQNTQTELITSSIKNRYGLTDREEDEKLKFGFINPDISLSEIENETASDGILSNGESSLQFFGTNDFVCNYRVSFFVGSRQVTVNNGYDYLTLEVSSGFITTADIIFDELQHNDVVYAIATPYGEDNASKMATRIVKTSSVVVIGG